MKTLSRIVLSLAFVLAAVSAEAVVTVPGTGGGDDPLLLDVFNHADGYGSDPSDPPPITSVAGPGHKHRGHVTILKLYEPGTGGPGGSLGGEAHTFSGPDGASFQIELFNEDNPQQIVRSITIPIDGIIETGPRTPGDAVQDFDTEMVQLQGAIFGDPDFDILAVRAGRNFGLPSPGHTTLTRLGPPGSDFVVDSFFDVFYEIDFQGTPGGILGGESGTESGSVRFGLGHTFDPAVPEPAGLGLVGMALAALRRRRS